MSNEALGRNFDQKVKFAKKIGKLEDETGDTVIIMHGFRNEVYHIGVQHEYILPAISAFYFKIACEFLGSYVPSWIGYDSRMVLPERARKYFEDQSFSMEGRDHYQAACTSLGNAIAIDAAAFAGTLADHLDQIIEEQDTAVHMIATGGPRQMSRDEAVADTMAWKVAFTEEAKDFARQKGWPSGSVLDFVEWIRDNYQLLSKADPVPSWQKRANTVRSEKNPHKAIKKYRDFMTQTADIRMALEEAHGQVEQYIDEQIERMRGN